MTDPRHGGWCVAVATILMLFVSAGGTTHARQTRADEPETVMITFRAKLGADAELARVIARHWETARRLNLVRDAPHVTVRATENGNQVYFVDIFTWRDASIPDAAPAAISAIWAEMNRLVESRGGRPGLDIKAVSLIDPASPRSAPMLERQP
jgi:hypothetical protein